MLSPYFNANTGTQLNSVSVGLEYIYRKPGKSYDIVTSLDFSWLDVADGNFLGVGPRPVARHALRAVPQPELRLGRRVDHRLAQVPALARAALRRRPRHRLRPGRRAHHQQRAAVHRRQRQRHDQVLSRSSPGPINGKPTATQEGQLQASMGGTDTNTTPHRHSGGVPPVMGVVNILVGLRFYPVRAHGGQLGDWLPRRHVRRRLRDTTCSEGRAAFAPRRRASSASRRRSARRAGWRTCARRRPAPSTPAA